MNALKHPVDLAARPAAQATSPVPGRWMQRLLDLRPYRVELLHRRQRIAPAAWALLALGLLAWATTVLSLRPMLVERDALKERAARLTDRVAALGLSADSTAPRHSAASKTGAPDELQEATALLHRPWHAFFEQIEAADAQESGAVHLVQLSVDPRFASVQMLADARDLGQIVRFTQRISGGYPIRTLTITHYEWRDALGGHVLSATLQGEIEVTRP